MSLTASPHAQALIERLIAASYSHAVAEVENILTEAERQMLKAQAVEAALTLNRFVARLENPLPALSFSDVMASHKQEFK